MNKIHKARLRKEPMRKNVLSKFKQMFPDLGDKRIYESERQFDERIASMANTSIKTAKGVFGHGITVQPKKREWHWPGLTRPKKVGRLPINSW